jgi:hypothetical protein
MRARQQRTYHVVGYLGDWTRPLPLPGHHPSPKAYRQTDSNAQRGNRQLRSKQLLLLLLLFSFFFLLLLLLVVLVLLPPPPQSPYYRNYYDYYRY